MISLSEEAPVTKGMTKPIFSPHTIYGQKGKSEALHDNDAHEFNTSSSTSPSRLPVPIRKSNKHFITKLPKSTEKPADSPSTGYNSESDSFKGSSASSPFHSSLSIPGNISSDSKAFSSSNSALNSSMLVPAASESAQAQSSTSLKPTLSAINGSDREVFLNNQSSMEKKTESFETKKEVLFSQTQPLSSFRQRRVQDWPFERMIRRTFLSKI